jgi:hypothetical protein
MGLADEATTQAITSLEDGLQEALMGPDLKWFAKNWVEDAIYVHMSGGVDSRDGFIERLRSRATVYQARELGDVRIRRYGGAVIVTGWSKIDILVSGVQRLIDSRFTRVYVNEHGGWLLATNQSGANTAAARS